MATITKTAHAKKLRDQALRLVRAGGRMEGYIETEGWRKRVVSFERGRLSISCILPLDVADERTCVQHPQASMVVRDRGFKVLSITWDGKRTRVGLLTPGDW